MVQNIEGQESSLLVRNRREEPVEVDEESADQQAVATHQSIADVVPGEVDVVSPAELGRIVDPVTYTSLGAFLDEFVPRLERHTPESFLDLYAPKQLWLVRIAANHLDERIGDFLKSGDITEEEAESLTVIRNRLRSFIQYTFYLEQERHGNYEHSADLGNQLAKYKTEAEVIIGEGNDSSIPSSIDILAENYARELRSAFEYRTIDTSTAVEFFISNVKALWEDEDAFKSRKDLNDLLPVMFEKAVKMGRLRDEDAEWFVCGASEEFGNIKNSAYEKCYMRGGDVESIEMPEESNDNPLWILEKGFCVNLNSSTSIFGKHRTGSSDQTRTFRVDDTFVIIGFDRQIGPCVHLICLRNDLDVWISPKDIKEIVSSDTIELH